MSENNKEKTDMQEAIEAQSEIFFSYVGKRLMEKRVEEYDRIAEENKDFKVPSDVHDKLEQMIAEEKKKAVRAVWTRRMKRAAKICSIAILVTIITSTILITNVDAFREKFQNFLVQIGRQDVDLIPDSGMQERPAGIPADWYGFWYPEYLPEGFSFNQAFDMANFKIILFENDSGDSIEISQFPADGSQIHLNNEVDQKGEVEISGRYTGHWIIEDEQLTLIWLQQNQIIEIITKVELNEAEKIAESLEYFY